MPNGGRSVAHALSRRHWSQSMAGQFLLAHASQPAFNALTQHRFENGRRPMAVSIRRSVARVALAILALLALTPALRAQDSFPSKPVHLLVPFPPGGAVDIVARTLADELGKHWPTNIIIDNRPGAGGTIAAEATAKAPPDGYTLAVVASGHAIVPYLYPKLAYDIFADFTPISLLGN